MAPQQIVDIPDVVPVPGSPLRERVVVRKRRSRKPHHTRQWSARASRQRAVRNFLLCVAVLLMMAVGVYMGLARQDVAPVEGSVAPLPAGTATTTTTASAG